ncbi:S8 family serine peptidase [Candidatus Pacearchaeota archaeon]|nr:S8 family serine peptidase [Candidatus Pacearchaeota archaeon]
MFSNGFVGEITAEGINILANNSNVTKILFDRVVHTTLQQSLPLINATDVWDLGYTGEGQTICVIDSGINYTHPDLGSCAYTNNISDGSCAKVIGGYDFRNDDDPIDDQGHGTHVAGIAAAQDEISPNNIEVK